MTYDAGGLLATRTDAEGKTSREIAKYLTISLKTAMTHRSNVMAKLNIHSRAEVTKYAIRKGIISVDS